MYIAGKKEKANASRVQKQRIAQKYNDNQKNRIKWGQWEKDWNAKTNFLQTL